ncbi:MAG: 6-phosphogluconolactonase [Nesterenkonia sp.]|nr:6-phosphogluconolactonase [Nesterenkonia sp.]
MTTTTIERHSDRDALCAAVAERLLEVLSGAVQDRGVAHAVLTGGGAGIGTLQEVARLIDAGEAETPDWSRVHFWWGDERLLAGGEPERNDEQADAALLRTLVSDHGLPAENVHRMPDTDLAVSPVQGAEAYSADLAAASDEDESDSQRAALRIPRFDVLLLGVGPDGHVASLFPGSETLAVTEVCCVGESESPKPPPGRITLTFDAIGTAERVWMVVAGSDKADAVARAHADGADVEDVPAVGAAGREETVWHVDEAAAERLPDS